MTYEHLHLFCESIKKYTTETNVGDIFKRLSTRAIEGDKKNSNSRLGSIANLLDNEEGFHKIMVAWLSNQDVTIQESAILKKRKRNTNELDATNETDTSGNTEDSESIRFYKPLNQRLLRQIHIPRKNAPDGSIPDWSEMLEQTAVHFLRTYYCDNKIDTKGKLYANDKAVDIRGLPHCVGECKYQNVSRQQIQTFVGASTQYAEAGASMHFFAKSYTSQAMEEAELKKVILHVCRLVGTADGFMMWIVPANN